jgi:alpha-glucosidase
VFRKNIEDAETKIGANHPLFVFDNHDNPRLDRYCKAEATDTGKAATAEECVAIQKMLSTLLFTSKATALMYYGDEIGMTTTPPTRKEDVKDPIGVTGWPLEKGRDGDRTPMQWTPGKDAGFSTAEKTWLPIPPNYKTLNVEVEKGQPGSLLTWYTELTALRRKNAAVHGGTMTMLDAANPKVLAYVRKNTTGEAVVVALNFTGQPQMVTLDAASVGKGKVSTLMTDAEVLKTVSGMEMTLPGYATWVGEIR